MATPDPVSVLGDSGPLTGAELLERAGMGAFKLWHVCRNAREVHFERFGTRYLRLDRNVEGYARLSPSIRREFQTYTVLGVEGQMREIREKSDRLREEIRQISRRKSEIARESMDAVVASLPDGNAILEKACFILAGDIAYQMSHSVPRPEESIGKMVRGSDLDIVVVVSPDLPEESRRALDRAIHQKKHHLLVHPAYREEIDYVVKDLPRVREQLRFDRFEFMVAAKILHEGDLLLGSPLIFRMVKELLTEHGIPARLESLEERARADRDVAERRLQEMPPESSDSEYHHLFYSREEREEIY